MSQTTIRVRVSIKNREECGQSIKGINAAYCSWAEQMLVNKLAKYGRKWGNHYSSYEVVAETEKAYKLRINDIYRAPKSDPSDFIDCEPWDIWLPKSACIVC